MSFFGYLLWFCLERSKAGGAGPPVDFVPARHWEALAFATVAAAAFVVFVLIGLIRDYDAAYGPNGTGNGKRWANVIKLALAVALGTLAAFMVAFVAIVVDLLQVNAQTAVLVGVTWQIVYAKLVSQMNANAGAIPGLQPQAPPRQKSTDESEE